MSDEKEQPIPDWQMDPDIVPAPLPVPEEDTDDTSEAGTDGEDAERG